MKKFLLFALFFPQPLLPATHLVTTVADSGAGSLRQAIIDANADLTTPRTINFAIGTGVQTIALATALPSLVASDIIIDGSTQPGWSAHDPQIILDGGAGGFNAIVIDGVDNCTIQDLVINNGFVNGISLINGASNCEIYGCFIGTNQAGTAASGLFGVGVSINALGADQSTDITIGAPNRGNVFSGNAAGGFFGGNLDSITLQGNFVGTDKTGSFAIPNTQAGLAFILMPGSDAVLCTNAQIGGLGAGEGNVISGNGPGAPNPVPGIFMGFQQVTGTVIQGNKIGVNAAGTAALPNDFGILSFIDFSTLSATIDGTIIEGNIISGNRIDGILLQFPTHNSVVKGNYIGTDITGTLAIPNGSNGIGGLTGNNNTIGGPLSSDRNIISGNVSTGIVLPQNTNDTVIQGNYIGVTSTGSTALANGNLGIGVFASTGNPSERTIIEDNVISANGQSGIFMSANTSNSELRGNYVGTDATGTIALGNGANGIEIQGNDTDASNGLIIGGTANGDGNIFSNNNGSGILLRANVSNAEIKGNKIGTDITGTLDFGNTQDGILIESLFTGSIASTNNIIGGLTAAEHNIILFNNVAGVTISGGPVGPDILNPILGNSIFANTFNGIRLFNGGNNEQESPTITNAVLCPVNDILTITVTAPANPAASNFRLELFVNSVDNSPAKEGELFIGAISSVPSGDSVTESFSVPSSVAVGQWVSATATNLNNVGSTPGDTSEFSANFEIQAAVAPAVNLVSSLGLIVAGSAVTLTATFSGTSPFDAVWSDGLTQLGVTSPIVRIVNPSLTTNFSVTITDANGCQDSDEVLVNVYQTNPLVGAIIEKYCV